MIRCFELFENLAFCLAVYQSIECFRNAFVSASPTVLVFWSRHVCSWSASDVATALAYVSVVCELDAGLVLLTSEGYELGLASGLSFLCLFVTFCYD